MPIINPLSPTARARRVIAPADRRVPTRTLLSLILLGLATMSACADQAGAAASPSPPPSPSLSYDQVKITDHYDSGFLRPFKVMGNVIEFDLREQNHPFIDCQIKAPSQELTIRLLLEKETERRFANQGLFVSPDGVGFELRPLKKVAEAIYECQVSVGGTGFVRISTNYPYGRDNLEQLLADTAGSTVGRWKCMRQKSRSVWLFEAGNDDGKAVVHYFIAGEDCREPLGQWVADRMIRILCTDSQLSAKVVQNAVIRICPLLSPYTASDRGHDSYTSELTGQHIYGAATWATDPLPPEIDLLHALIVKTIQERRLGMALTIHSWWAKQPRTELQTIRSAGGNVLSAERVQWATATMNRFMENVPHAYVTLPERTWHPGLMREVMLERYNAITFRVEVTTQDQVTARGEATAEAFLKNLAKMENWDRVLH